MSRLETAQAYLILYTTRYGLLSWNYFEYSLYNNDWLHFDIEVSKWSIHHIYTVRKGHTISLD